MVLPFISTPLQLYGCGMKAETTSCKVLPGEGSEVRSSSHDVIIGSPYSVSSLLSQVIVLNKANTLLLLCGLSRFIIPHRPQPFVAGHMGIQPTVYTEKYQLD